MPALGNLADIPRGPERRPLYPESGHVQCNYGCPLRANSGHAPRPGHRGYGFAAGSRHASARAPSQAWRVAAWRRLAGTDE
jgi:hypothetical protein